MTSAQLCKSNHSFGQTSLTLRFYFYQLHEALSTMCTYLCGEVLTFTVKWEWKERLHGRRERASARKCQILVILLKACQFKLMAARLSNWWKARAGINASRCHQHSEQKHLNTLCENVLVCERVIVCVCVCVLGGGVNNCVRVTFGWCERISSLAPLRQWQRETANPTVTTCHPPHHPFSHPLHPSPDPNYSSLHIVASIRLPDFCFPSFGAFCCHQNEEIKMT